MDFVNLTKNGVLNKTAINKIIREYNLKTKIRLSENKIKKSLEELAQELDKHLIIDTDGLIKFKVNNDVLEMPVSSSKPKKAPEPKKAEPKVEPKKEKVKVEPKKAPEPKVEVKVEPKVEPKKEAVKVEPKIETVKAEPFDKIKKVNENELELVKDLEKAIIKKDEEDINELITFSRNIFRRDNLNKDNVKLYVERVLKISNIEPTVEPVKKKFEPKKAPEPKVEPVKVEPRITKERPTVRKLIKVGRGGTPLDENGLYALHAVIIKKPVELDEAKIIAKSFIKDPKKKYYRETANSYRFRNISKQKFEEFRSHPINENITLVFGKLKKQYEGLKGSGIFSNLLNKLTGAVKQNIIEPVKQFLKPRLDGFNNISKRTIEKYGNDKIRRLFIIRTPLDFLKNKLLDIVSLGEFSKLQKKHGFDKLYHLGLIAELENGQRVMMEKNETVDITTDIYEDKTSEKLEVDIGNLNLTINKILEDARNKVGDKVFFEYNAFTNNCQFFIKYLLENQGLYGEKEKEFLFQDVRKIMEELPPYVPKTAKFITDLAGTFSKIVGKGKGGKNEKLKQKVYFE
jgi:hypothetical protein